MVKHELMIITDYSRETLLTLNELCDICQVPSHVIQDLVAYDIAHPRSGYSQWLFGLDELRRVKIALRLMRDLEINVAGVVVVLDLLDEVKELRERARLLERHFVSLKRQRS